MNINTERQDTAKPGIVYSCYHTSSRDGEHFVPAHTLSFQIAGSLVLTDGSKSYASSTGMLRVIRRNQLLKFMKQPPAEGDFQSLSIYFSQQLLKDFSMECDMQVAATEIAEPVINITATPMLLAYIRSLIDYSTCNGLDKAAIVQLKLREGLLLLLEANPSLKNILFDFTEPHKIDLEEFMIRNYHFNVKLDRFAYLTGRSLATFKRDFQKIFQKAPRQWIQEQRLQEAHFLLTHKGQTASKVYLDLGFENLSHFSYSFKNFFGYPPSGIPGPGV